jgi:hypothetical protein
MIIEDDLDDIGIDLDNFDKEAEIAKYQDYTLRGWQILVRLYIPKKSASALRMPDQVQKEKEYQTFCGLVVKIGNLAYYEDRYKEHWCKLGEWVVFPNHSGSKVPLKRVPCFMINDEKAQLVVPDPRFVTYNYTY